MKVKAITKFLAVLIVAPLLLAQSGCPTATTGSIGSGKIVKDDMIVEIKGEIKALGGTPLTEAEIKYQGKLNKDKYIVALRNQLNDIKRLKEEEEKKAEADKKAEEEKKKAAEAKKKKEKDRAKVIQQIKKEIYFLGGTPLLEFELGSEDKYIAALKKQIDELKAEKQAKEKEVNETFPEWFTTPSDEKYFYVPGTATSDSLQLALDNAINAAFKDLAKRVDGRQSSKAKEIIHQAGLGDDSTSKTTIDKVTNIVTKDVNISGYEVVQRKMVTLDNGNYRIFVLLKYPLAKTYSVFVNQIQSDSELSSGTLAKIKNTAAFKELEKAVNEFSGS